MRALVGNILILQKSVALSEEVLPPDGNEILGNSIPILYLTPVVINNITSPDISESNISSEEQADETENFFSDPETTDMALLDPDYTNPKVEDTI